MADLLCEGNRILETLPLADAIRLLRPAQVVARESWMDERPWESPANEKYRRCRAERDRQPTTSQREVR
jgi:hypothetical protein